MCFFQIHTLITRTWLEEGYFYISFPIIILVRCRSLISILLPLFSQRVFFFLPQAVLCSSSDLFSDLLVSLRSLS